MKFEQNKITFYLGIGYLILALVSLFNLLQANILAGLTTAGLFFSLSLLGLAIENSLVEKKPLSSFATSTQKPTTLEKLKTVRALIYKTPRHTDLFKYVHIGSGVCFMLGFILLVALPGFPLGESLLNKISSFCYVASIGSIFIAFYLEERQSEKTQKAGEQEMIDYLFNQIEAELKETDSNENPESENLEEQPENAPEPQEAPVLSIQDLSVQKALNQLLAKERKNHPEFSLLQKEQELQMPETEEKKDSEPAASEPKDEPDPKEEVLPDELQKPEKNEEAADENTDPTDDSAPIPEEKAEKIAEENSQGAA